MSEFMGDLPWIIGTLAAIAFFAFFEARAFRYPARQNTLSHAVYTIGSNWPLSIFLMGMFAGGLAVHFFWHWCPAGSVSTGMLGSPITLSNDLVEVPTAIDCSGGRCLIWSKQ